MKARFPLLALVTLALVALIVFGTELSAVAYGQTTAAAAADPWPRHMQISGGTMTVYQPQVDSWDGGFLKLRAAVAVKPDGGGEEVFGIVRASAHTLVDKSTRMVTLFNFSLLQIDFPTLANHGQQYYSDVGRFLPAGTKQVSLDRLQAFLSVEKVTPKAVAVQNGPPQIIVSYKPAVLVPIHGQPIQRQLPGSALERVVNTRALIVYGPSGEVFVHVYDGWMASSGLNGPWHVASDVSPSLDQIAAELSKVGEVDLLEGSPKDRLSLTRTVPAIYITEGPTELIVFNGQPSFEPIAGTQLLWVTNASGDVIMDTTSNSYYLLISGRWFRATSLSGPWGYVASNDLPAEFGRIPANTPAAEVLTAVAGTPQAKEAVIANSVPQTALIPRQGGPQFTPALDGTPQYRAIEGTTLQYVWNSPDAIIRVNATVYYALRNGVWFTANSLSGSWLVAASVPDVIYTIPPSSPLHYVTYVDIYWASPESVEVGYTPGYMGTVVAPDGVVVYGTGYDYPAWVGTTYYPPPLTYGYAAYPAYDVAAGAMFGFAMGMTTAALLAPAPYWGAAYYNSYYNRGGCCWGGENVYGHYGNTTYSGYHDYGYNPYTGNAGAAGSYHTYNAATGVSSNIQGYHGYNAYTGEQAAGYNRQFHNNYTGTSGDVTRNASYNPETGNWDKSGSGSAYNPNTGLSASVQHTSEGNAYSGKSAGQTSATVTNAMTGQTKTYDTYHGSNNVYAGSDGQVYKNTGGGWQKSTSNGWQSASSSHDSNLDGYSQARGYGENRYDSFAQRSFYRPPTEGGFGGGFRGGFRR
jgi:hypothetical protein